jgi:hypothetical protein
VGTSFANFTYTSLEAFQSRKISGRDYAIFHIPAAVDGCELAGFGREIISTAVSSNKPKNTFREADLSCRKERLLL